MPNNYPTRQDLTSQDPNVRMRALQMTEGLQDAIAGPIADVGSYSLPGRLLRTMMNVHGLAQDYRQKTTEGTDLRGGLDFLGKTLSTVAGASMLNKSPFPAKPDASSVSGIGSKLLSMFMSR